LHVHILSARFGHTQSSLEMQQSSHHNSMQTTSTQSAFITQIKSYYYKNQ
jgi:hypothetical protein